MTAKRKWVEANFCELDQDMPLEVLSRVVASAQLSEKNGQWRCIRLHTYANDYEDSVNLVGERQETDAELNSRLKRERDARKTKKQIAESLAERERLEYKRLKAKYG